MIANMDIIVQQKNLEVTMAKDPAFLFYSQDFYAGTRTMLPEERACYIDLLIYQHQNGFIPNELNRILMFCNGIDEATLQATLEAKFERTDKGWINKKLLSVVEERAEYKEKQSENGKVGQFYKKAKERLNAKELKELKDFINIDYTREKLIKDLNNSESIEATLEALLKASLKHLEDEDEIEIEDENIILIKDFEKNKIFNDWLQYRKEIKKPIKAKKTLDLLAKKFDENDLNKCRQVVNASISNSWQGLFWDKGQEKEKDNFSISKIEV